MVQDYGRHTPPPGMPAMTKDEMLERYAVLGWTAPYVAVRRKSDGVKGTLEFTHRPRFYYDFKPDPV